MITLFEFFKIKKEFESLRHMPHDAVGEFSIHQCFRGLLDDVPG
jgi:hypothetical protein